MTIFVSMSKKKENKKSFNLMLTPSVKDKGEKKAGKKNPKQTLSQYVEELIVFDLTNNDDKSSQ